MSHVSPTAEREPRFFADPMTDNLLGAVVALAAEVSILRDRLFTLEGVLQKAGVVPADAVETHADDDERARARGENRKRFVERILAELSRGDVPASKGLHAGGAGERERGGGEG